MNLAAVLKLDLAKQAILVGVPEKTVHVDRDDKPYYKVQLVEPVLVGCSMDTGIDTFETKEVYVREADINSEGWVFVDEADHTKGFYRDGWVVDFSQGQALPLYQETTIKKWSKEQRGDRRTSRRDELNKKIQAGVIGQ